MKNSVQLGMLTGALLLACASFAQDAPNTVAPGTAPREEQQTQSRSLSGTVYGPSESVVLKDSVVYLKNTKTLTLKSYIVGEDGKYQFHALLPNVDYEIYAEKEGKRSDVRRLSSFDSRRENVVNLKIDR